jgi:hypothetical protein
MNQIQSDPNSMEDYLNMQADTKQYQAFANNVVAELAKGNPQFLKDNFSPNAIPADPPRFLDSVLLPAVQIFFTNFDHIGKPVTLRASSDAHGNTGYSSAMSMVYKDGTEKPFKIHIVKEDGRLFVAEVDFLLSN